MGQVFAPVLLQEHSQASCAARGYSRAVSGYAEKYETLPVEIERDVPEIVPWLVFVIAWISLWVAVLLTVKGSH